MLYEVITFYKHKGLEHIIGPKPVIEQSFKDGIIKDGKGWVEMHKSRNLTSHTYNEETATDIVNAIHTRITSYNVCYTKLLRLLMANNIFKVHFCNAKYL